VRYGNIFIYCSHYYRSKQSNRQGGARAVDLPARSFDLARPGACSAANVNIPIAVCELIGVQRLDSLPYTQESVM